VTALILGVVFIATLSLIIGLFLFSNRRRLAALAAARQRLREDDDVESARGLLRDERASELPLLNRLLTGRAVTEDLRALLQQAGLRMSPGGFLMLVAVCTLAGLALGMLLARPVFTVLGVAAGFLLPVWWLRRKARKRLQTFEAQLPEAIDMMVTAMRSGYSFQAAMRFIGQEMPAPLGPEFARFYDQQRLGVEVRTALLGMLDRIPSLDLRMLVTAVLIQRDTGGMLSEVLSNIAMLMRERVAVRAQIETLTAEPKLSARVLAAAPVVVYLGLLVADPEYVQPLTAETIGRVILVAAAAFVSMGYWLLMRIADVDY